MDNIELQQLSNAILLPAFADTNLSQAVKSFLSNGGCSILIGESRTEYTNREMSKERKQNETASALHSFIEEAKAIQKNLIVAIDQEIIGIQRLHHLVPAFPNQNDLKNISSEDFQLLCQEIAFEAKKIGINCFLAPILDCVTGINPWLNNRTYSKDPNEIARISSIYIKGVQQSKVIATAKHFPGFSNIPLDPALEKEARMDSSIQSINTNLLPFKKAIENKVEMVMVGPAIVKAIDPINPASTSKAVISILRNDLKFDGIILSDDLDAKATMLDLSIEQVAVKALQAGCDFLLLADIEDQITSVSKAIVEATLKGDLDLKQLEASAMKVKSLARKYT